MASRNLCGTIPSKLDVTCMFCCCSMLISTGVQVEPVEAVLTIELADPADGLLALHADKVLALHQRRSQSRDWHMRRVRAYGPSSRGRFRSPSCMIGRRRAKERQHCAPLRIDPLCSPGITDTPLVLGALGSAKCFRNTTTKYRVSSRAASHRASTGVWTRHLLRSFVEPAGPREAGLGLRAPRLAGGACMLRQVRSPGHHAHQ